MKEIYQICVDSSNQGWGAILIDKSLSVTSLGLTPIICFTIGLWFASFSHLISNNLGAEAIVWIVRAFSPWIWGQVLIFLQIILLLIALCNLAIFPLWLKDILFSHKLFLIIFVFCKELKILSLTTFLALGGIQKLGGQMLKEK